VLTKSLREVPHGLDRRVASTLFVQGITSFNRTFLGVDIANDPMVSLSVEGHDDNLVDPIFEWMELTLFLIAIRFDQVNGRTLGDEHIVSEWPKRHEGRLLRR
jgi:hypothetical protein